jgi:hypothetical protein
LKKVEEKPKPKN